MAHTLHEQDFPKIFLDLGYVNIRDTYTCICNRFYSYDSPAIWVLFFVIILVSILGSMVCIGQNNYFRFNHPKEAAQIKEQYKSSRFSIVPDGVYPGRSLIPECWDCCYLHSISIIVWYFLYSFCIFDY